MSLRIALALGVMTVLSIANQSFAADVGKMPQILVHLRFLQGDATKPKTVKTISAPSVLTASGQPATFTMGEEHLHDASGMRIVSGIDCKIKPTVRDDGRVSMELEFTVTRPVKEVADGVAVQGTCIRSNLLLTPGKCQQIRGLKHGDAHDTWLEVTAELANPATGEFPKP